MHGSVLRDGCTAGVHGSVLRGWMHDRYARHCSEGMDAQEERMYMRGLRGTAVAGLGVDHRVLGVMCLGCQGEQRTAEHGEHVACIHMHAD